MQAWGKLAVAFSTSTGNLTQLYPTWDQSVAQGQPVGDALPIAPGGTLRTPMGGRVGQLSFQSDGTNGGIIEVWDINGLDFPADVSSLTQITNAQLVALQARGKAQLLGSYNIAGSPTVPAVGSLAFGFMRGLAARFVAGAGQVNLNLIAEGGVQYRSVPCGFAG